MPSVRLVRVSLLTLCFAGACAQAPSRNQMQDDEDDVTPPVSMLIDSGMPDDPGVFDASPSATDSARPSVPARDAQPPVVVDAGPSVPPTDAGHTGEGGEGTFDAGLPDAASRDAAMPPPMEAGPPPTPEAGLPEAGLPEAGPAEAGAPDAGVRCIPGTYSGSFSGEISALFGIIRIDISGTISIDITPPAASSDQLPIRNGKLDGKDSENNPIVATISGTLNCTTRRLENGRITNGMYTRRDPIYGGAPRTVGFNGVATAVYNLDPPSAAGQWEVVNETGLRAGSGAFSTTLVR